MDFENGYTLLALFAEMTYSERALHVLEGIHLPQVSPDPLDSDIGMKVSLVKRDDLKRKRLEVCLKDKWVNETVGSDSA